MGLSLLQTAIVKHHKQDPGPKCGVVPTICPEEGNAKTDIRPEGCKYIESCEMCEEAAVFWNLSYGGKNNWPNPPRPTGCFRNRKWQIKCNDEGPSHSLYLPAPLLKPGPNYLQLFELHPSAVRWPSVMLSDKATPTKPVIVFHV